MIIELRGVEFQNKGAELMLHAILQIVKQRVPNAIFVMEHRGGSAPMSKQRAVGIYTKLNIKKFGIDTAKVGLLLPRFVRRKFGFIHEKEIDVVLDGSGFAFGDFWGAKKAGERLADHIQAWKKGGKKVIMLSQAFGPFRDTALQRKMAVILNHADLIFARDKYSYDYLRSIPANQQRIKLKPDFTNLIKGSVPAYFNVEEAEIALIPNNKLLESSTFTDRDHYLEVLNNLVEIIESAGKIPFFLIHEGAKDLKLAEDVNKKYGRFVKIIQESDPLKVKGIIGASKGVVTSRFHGLVSALSQAVPCLCIGWSHKYEALMEDYQYKEGLITNEELQKEALRDKLQLILDDQSAKAIHTLLERASVEQKEQSRAMWDDIFNVLEV